MSKGKIVSLT